MPGVLLLFRTKDGGRAGKIWVTLMVLFYWVLSTPITAMAFVDLLLAKFATGHVEGRRARRHGDRPAQRGNGGVPRAGSSYDAPTRDGSLRVLEAARVHGMLGGVPIVATGGHGASQCSEAEVMAHQLEQLGVPADHIIKEERSTNTRDHAMLVPPLLTQRGIGQFVLVTSRSTSLARSRSFAPSA